MEASVNGECNFVRWLFPLFGGVLCVNGWRPMEASVNAECNFVRWPFPPFGGGLCVNDWVHIIFIDHTPIEWPWTSGQTKCPYSVRINYCVTLLAYEYEKIFDVDFTKKNYNLSQW